MVEFLIGKREVHAFGKEAVSYGTQAATISRFFGKNARYTGIKDDADFQEILNAGGNTLNVEGFEVGHDVLGGVIQFAPQEWRFLEYVFGSVTDAGAGPYTHTFNNLVTLPSFTYERAKKATTDRVHRYLGGKVKSFTIDWNAAGGGQTGKLVNVSLDTVFQSANNGTSASSITPPTTAAFKARNVKLTLNTVEQVECLSGSMVVENNLHDALYANSTLDTKIGEPTPEIRRVNGRFTVLSKDDTHWDLWEAKAEVGGTNTLEFIRSATDKLVCTFTGLVMKAVPSESNLGGINTVDIVWSARSVSCVATDSISAYN
jgi:hypothetical protein